MEKNRTEVRGRTGSIASIQNAQVIAAATGPKSGGSWLERKLKPKKINARYPIKGKGLLFATCGFGSLGDALFGYNSGMIKSPEISAPLNANSSKRYHVRLAR